MSKAEDQLDTGGAMTDLVFDDNQHERRSWRFCNSRIPRSEVVYFTQVYIIIFLIIFPLVKLVFFQLECEESTFWFSLLSCTVGYALPNPKLWIKSFQQLTGCLWPFAVRHVVEKQSLLSECYSKTLFWVTRGKMKHTVYQIFKLRFDIGARKLSVGVWRFIWREF